MSAKQPTPRTDQHQSDMENEDFGEPWHEQEPPPVRAGVYWLNPRQFNRIVTCVNACAKMADPAAEIQAMRDKIERQRKELNKFNNGIRSQQNRERQMRGELDKMRIYEGIVRSVRKTLAAANEEKTEDAAARVASEVKTMREAVRITKDLAEWSARYPRGIIYSASNPKMDEELVELEKQATAALAKLQPFLP